MLLYGDFIKMKGITEHNWVKMRPNNGHLVS